jgi:hypothetical protein
VGYQNITPEERIMSNNFYSNNLMVKIRMDERMAEAESYRRATQIEQTNLSERHSHQIASRPFGWLRRLVVRIGGVGA